jgi:hypothetical protein
VHHHADEEARQGSRRRHRLAALVLLGATLFGQTTVSAELAYPYTPSEVAEVIRGLHHLLAAGLGLIMAAMLYQD